MSNKNTRAVWLKRLAFILLIVLATILSPIVGGYATLIYAGLSSSGNLTKWQSIGSPPSKANKFLGICRGDICVEGNDGKMYKNTSINCMQSLETLCWEEWVRPDEIIDPVYNICENWQQFTVEPQPINTIDLMKTKACSSGGMEQINYALISDGSVWVWSHTIADLEGIGWFGAVFYAGVGCLILALIIDAIILYIFLWLRYPETLYPSQ